MNKYDDLNCSSVVKGFSLVFEIKFTEASPIVDSFFFTGKTKDIITTKKLQEQPANQYSFRLYIIVRAFTHIHI